MEELKFSPEEFKESAERFKPIEKDLDSPIMLDNSAESLSDKENIEEKVLDKLLSQEELDTPIDGVTGIEEVGLSAEQKSVLKESTGWCDEIIDSIKSNDEATVYVQANLREFNGNLERTDIDWNAKVPEDRIERMRSLYGDEVADKWAGKNNLDLIKEGKAPYGPDGQQVNLHHIGQHINSPLAELTYTEHKKNDGVLHDKTLTSEIERPVFRMERKQYWQTRYGHLQ